MRILTVVSGVAALLFATAVCAQSTPQQDVKNLETCKGLVDAPPRTAFVAKEREATLIECANVAERQGQYKLAIKASRQALDMADLDRDLRTKWFSTTLADDGGKLRIRILTEEPTDSFRLAAAEVIRSQFSDSLVIVPDSELVLYVSGTEPSRSGNVQSIYIRVQTSARHMFLSANQERSLFVSLIFAESGEVLQNYTPEHKTQAVKEETYKVISDFLQKWEKGKPQASP